ncbi:Protein prenyltransferase alpha subunit repeat-containing protein 1 [Entophlyctis luteolus]|nr:Protein prenyltransferase alpha subunit repeat-containing protein 1 [Entophlyctis luteolus]
MDLYCTFCRLLAVTPPSSLIDFGFIAPGEYLAAPAGQEHLPFLVIDGNLGVPADAIEPVMRSAHSELFALLPGLRSSPSGVPEAGTFYYEQHRVELCFVTDIDRLDKATMSLVLLNPEFYTAWNVRRDIFRVLSPQNELALVDLVLSKHPKRPSAWAYRAWVFQRLIIEISGDISAQEAAFAHELAVCTQAAQRHRMNYHAWTYRWKLVDSATFEQKQLGFQTVRDFMSANVSEHSAYAHALAILESIISHNAQKTSILDSSKLLEIEVADAMRRIVSYPGHKSAWCYIQGLFLIIRRHSFETLNNSSVMNQALFESDFKEVQPSLSEIDLLESFDRWILKIESGKLLEWIVRFSAWIIAAAQTIVRNHVGTEVSASQLDETSLSRWQDQIEIARTFQLFILVGEDGAIDARKMLLESVRKAGGWPEFVFRVLD